MNGRLALGIRLVFGLAAALAAAPARGETESGEGPHADVAVLRPVGDDPVLVEASRRLQLELGASGLASALVDVGEGFSARVALVRVDGVVTIDVLGTPAAGAPRHRRVTVPPEDGGGDPAVIAVRAAELLRGIRLEVRRATAPAPARAQVFEPAPEPARAPEGPAFVFRFEAGVGVLSARPFGAALAAGPAVAASGAIAPHVSVTAALAGPFFTDRPPTPEGSAHTREELGGIGLRADTWRARLNAHVAATAGLHHVSATYDARGLPSGTPSTIHFFTPQSVWNPALTVAAGATFRLSRRFGVGLQLSAVFIEPPLALTANGRSLGTLGEPSLLSTLSAWTTL